MALQPEINRRSAAAEWRSHWRLVLASSLGYTLIGVINFSLGPFMAPLQKAFGWSRSEITSGLPLYAVTCVLCQPIVGRMIDRLGPRRIALGGLAATGGAISLFATANGSLGDWLILWLVYSVCAQFILTPVWTSAVASEFESGLGLALAFTLSGSALCGVVAPFAATRLIDTYGWRTAYPILGAVPAAALLVVVYFCFYSRRDRLERSVTAVPTGSTGLSTREALRSPAFWKLGLAVLGSFSLMMAFSIHMLPILTAAGLGREHAALIAGSYGLFAVVGKFSYGLLAARFRGHFIAAAVVLLPVVSCALLAAPNPSMLACFIAISFVGISSGGQLQLLVFLTTRHFGQRSFGVIFGFISWSLTIASGVGPLLAGRIFDETGNYQLLLTGGVPLSILASLLLIWVGDYPEVQVSHFSRVSSA